MDPIAHTLFGAALSRTRLARVAPARVSDDRQNRAARGATLALVVGANLPDVDAALYLLGNDLSLFFRRGISHGPVGLLVLPPLFLMAWRWLRRWRGRADLAWARLLWLVYLGALSHPVLDWLNTYGVRFLAPFDWRWFYGDTLFIVDPWMWLLLGAATLLGGDADARTRRLFRVMALVASVSMMVAAALDLLPVGAAVGFLMAVVVIAVLSRRRVFSTRLATGLVALFVVYVLLMVFAARSSRASVRAALEKQGHRVERLVVSPLPATAFDREWVALIDRSYWTGSFAWLEKPRLRVDGPIFPALEEEDPIVARALADPCIRGFVNWMRLPAVEIADTADGDAKEVRLFDLRYTRSPVDGFGGARSVVEPVGVGPANLGTPFTGIDRGDRLDSASSAHLIDLETFD